MSLAKTKYGIEYNPGKNRDGRSGAGWAVAAVLAVAAVSFASTVARRMAEAPREPAGTPRAAAAASATRGSETPRAGADAGAPGAAGAEEPSVEIDGLARRSPRVRSLMLRFDEAARLGDLEMQISTIERIRSLPPGEAADIAAALLPRLGRLNWDWLFVKKNPQWVGEVSVKSGDSATRIAQENGSTLASFKKLNDLENPGRLAAGQRVWVMRHPRFNVVVYKRMKAVDVFLNGKLFKRYLMPDGSPEVRFAPGDYKTPANLKDFLRRMGVGLAPEDADEIDLIVPRGSTLNVTAS